MTCGNRQPTTSKKCICGKICKNSRGLKIHQSRMKSLEGKVVTQHSGSSPSEMQEEPGPESPHSTRSLHVPQQVQPSRLCVKVWVKQPQACNTAAWQQFDKDADKVCCDATPKGDVERRLQTMTIMVSQGVERFGEVGQKPSRVAYTKNQRAAKSHKIRQELKSVEKQHKEASEELQPPAKSCDHPWNSCGASSGKNGEPAQS